MLLSLRLLTPLLLQFVELLRRQLLADHLSKESVSSSSILSRPTLLANLRHSFEIPSNRENVNNTYENTSMRQSNSGTRDAGSDPSAELVNPPPPPPSYVMAHPNVCTWVTSACRFGSAAFGFPFLAFTVLCRVTLMSGRKPRISVYMS